MHCWDSQVPVCAQCLGSLGAGTVYQGLSGGGLALSSPGNLILMTWPGSRGWAKSLTPVDGFQVPAGSVGPSGEGHSGSEDRLPSLVCPLCGQALLNVGGKITPGFLTSSHVLPSSPPPHRESAVCASQAWDSITFIVGFGCDYL